MALNLACMVLMFVCTLAGRDTATVAAIGAAHGRRPGVLLVWTACTLTALALAVWIGASIGNHLVATDRTVLACLVAMFAAMELLFVPMPRGLQEPTHSLGALFLVLMVRLLTGATLAVLLAFALVSRLPIQSGLAGIGAALLASVLVWLRSGHIRGSRIQLGRRLSASAVLLVTVVLALSGAKIL